MRNIDVTVIRLLDGAKAYLQAIIDNYSRRILAWRLSKKLELDKKNAREMRIKVNRELDCNTCKEESSRLSAVC